VTMGSEALEVEGAKGATRANTADAGSTDIPWRARVPLGIVAIALLGLIAACDGGGGGDTGPSPPSFSQIAASAEAGMQSAQAQIQEVTRPVGQLAWDNNDCEWVWAGQVWQRGTWCRHYETGSTTRVDWVNGSGQVDYIFDHSNSPSLSWYDRVANRWFERTGGQELISDTTGLSPGRYVTPEQLADEQAQASGATSAQAQGVGQQYANELNETRPGYDAMMQTIVGPECQNDSQYGCPP
jgi:hypothetical protein